MNTLQTALRTAVFSEDYTLAAKIKVRIDAMGGGSGGKVRSHYPQGIYTAHTYVTMRHDASLW
jgi:hypothetical protein